MPFQTTPDGRFAVVDDFQFSLDTFQTQADVQLASIGSGFVAVWNHSGYAGSDVVAQLFDGNGQRVGTEFTIAAGTSAAVTAMPSGGFVVTWAAERPYPAAFDIYVQRFDSSGQPVGSASPVNTTTNGFQVAPSVTALAGGGFVVTWENRDSGDVTYDDIRAQVFDASGNEVGGEIVATDAKAGDKIDPDITALAGADLSSAGSSGVPRLKTNGEISAPAPEPKCSTRTATKWARPFRSTASFQAISRARP